MKGGAPAPPEGRPRGVEYLIGAVVILLLAALAYWWHARRTGRAGADDGASRTATRGSSTRAFASAHVGTYVGVPFSGADMSAQAPEDVHRFFREWFRARDVDRLLSLFERDALFVPQPGHAAVGHAAIREALAGFLALGGRFEMTPEPPLVAGDVALLYSSWSLSGAGPDGVPFQLAGRTSDVVRRQPDGAWLITIDNPYGGAATPASPGAAA
jgi:ketosteroid isomerase-like protein